MGKYELGCELSIYSMQPSRRVAQPGVIVDQEEVVSRVQDPADSGLPTQVPAVVVVLDAVGHGDPGTELGPDIGLENADREAALRQFDARPFVAQANDQAVSGPDGETRFEIASSPAEVISPTIFSSKSDGPLAAHAPVHFPTVVPVLVSRWQDNGIVRSHAEISFESFEFSRDSKANPVPRMKVHLKNA